MIKGNVPGNKNSFVIIKTAVKKPNVKNAKADLINYKKAEVKEENIEVAENNSTAE
jgi:hypothetical protein